MQTVEPSLGSPTGEEGLAHRHRAALAVCARVLLSADDLSQVDDALAALLAATDATSIFVELNVEDPEMGPCSTMVREISRSGIDQANANWSRVPWSQMPDSFVPLSQGEPCAFLIKELGPTERALYEGIDALSELDVPFFVDGKWIGLIGLSEDRLERAWRADEVGLMVTAAQMMEAFWERKQAREVAEQLAESSMVALRYQRALVASSRALLTVDDEQAAFGMVLEALTEATAVDYGFIERNEEQPGAGLCSRTIHECDRTDTGGDIDQYWELVPWSNMPDSYARLSRGEAFAFAIDELGPVERTLYESDPYPARSEVNIPIFVDGSWEGLIGFSDKSIVRHWTAEEMELLATVADLIGAHWARRQSQQRLTELIKEKDAFLASVSHELRTPLTVVVGLAAELNDQSNGFSSEMTQELIDVIARQSMDLADIVDDLLVAARIDGEIHVVPARIDLGIEASSVVAALGMENVKVSGAAVAWADASRFRQIIRNLLTNARRYGGPNVEVKLSALPDRAIARVIDDGPGVSAGMIDKLFEPYQAGSAASTQPDSIGLGLTISRTLATRMGGDLRYSAENGNTVFSLALPRAPRAR